MLWGLLQARAGLQSLRRCLTSGDGQGRPVDGSFSHHGSGCGTWPSSGLGAGVRWCPLPREVALRGRRSQVPCRDALPGTAVSLQAPAPAAPGTCPAVKLQPCREAQVRAPGQPRASPRAFPYVPWVFSSILLLKSGVPPAQPGSSAAVAERGCRSEWLPAARGHRTGRLFEELHSS